MTDPQGVLHLDWDWLSKDQLGLIVRGGNTLIHAGRVDRYDPDSVARFMEGISKRCATEQLEGVGGDLDQLREGIEQVIVEGPGKKRRNRKSQKHDDGVNARNDPRRNIKFRPHDLHEATRVTDEIMSALDPPAIYQRGRTVVRIANKKVIVNERGMREHRKGDEPMEGEKPGHCQIIQLLKEPCLKSTLTEHIVYWYLRVDGWQKGGVPPDVVKDYVQRVEWGLPALEGITNVPILHDGGTVHATPGYDRESGYFLTDACRFEIPEAPDWSLSREALDELKLELISDFPFAALHHRSAALAALFQRAIQPSFQPALNEVVPGYLITSPIRGSGKGLLAKVISMVVDGQLPFLTTPPEARDKAEWRKLLMTLALEGHPAILFDNVESGSSFGSSVLDAVMTAGRIGDRILGVSKSGEVFMNCTFFATGNNIGLRSDAARRLLSIQIDAKTERPDLRQDWRHADLVKWAAAHRARMISLVFTILRAHALAGRPGVPPREAYDELRRRCVDFEPGAWEPLETRPPRLGSFERWDDLVRAALLWLGEADPCAGMQDVIDTTDEDTQHRADLLQALWAVFGEQEFLSRDAWAQAEHGKDDTPSPDPANPNRKIWPKNLALYHALRGDDPSPLTTKRVGKRIGAIAGAIWNGMVLRRIEGRANQISWRIEVLGQGSEQGEIPF